MFDNTNPYTLRAEIVGGIAWYYVSFTDGQTIQRETDVSSPVYLEFLRFIRIERNLHRWDERHMEKYEVTEEVIHNRALCHPESLEETVFGSFQNEQLRLAIQNLPEIQRRRFILHHEFGFTYKQIAEIEGCSGVSAFKSVARAEDSIIEKLKYL